MDFAIKEVKAREILDSRGNPTIEVEMRCGKSIAIASAPSGASKGKNEAVEIRGGKAFHGKSVEMAIENVNKIIAPALKGMDVREQEEIDRKLIAIDGTKNKSLLGGNACIAVSMAAVRCAALAEKKELYEYINEGAKLLPVPFLNVINGGMHAGNSLAIQEHMIVPIKARSFKEAMIMACETYYSLKEIIKEKHGKNAINVGDEGGFAPPLKSSYEALELIMKAIEENGYENEIKLAIDAAASSFFDGEFYEIDGKKMKDELLDFYIELASTFPIISIEDAFHEEDWHRFAELTKKIGNKVQIVGDDIFVTNPKRLKKGIKMEACNALLLKPNQIGTVTEAIEVAKICKENGYAIMVSHRSGETCDDFIADLAVAIEAGQIKAGAPARGERVAKYNRLMKIEEELEKKEYAGIRWKKMGL